MPSSPDRMASEPTTPRTSALLPLLVINVGAVCVLGVTGLALQPRPIDPSTLDLVHAEEVLDIERTRLEDYRGDLRDARRSSTAGFLSLQAQAAELTVLELEWEELPREGPLVPVLLLLRFSGDPLNVPILAHGLYNLNLPLEVRLLELTFVGEDFVLGRLELCFWRAAEFELERLPAVEGLDEELARLAAEVSVRESVQAALDQHLANRAENRRWLTWSLPALALGGQDGVLEKP